MKNLCLAVGLVIATTHSLALKAEAPQLKAPAGLKVEVWAENINNARSLSLSESKEWLFVGTRSDDKVYAIRVNETSTRKALVIAEGLNSPNGVAMKNGTLFVAEINRILAFDQIEEQLQAKLKKSSHKIPYRVVTDKYPKDGHHGWKFIRFSPDGKLFVPVGAPCDTCEREDPYAGITSLDIKTGKYEVVARGVRNTVGFDWDSKGRFWFTDNGRDHMGDDKPPCEINRLDTVGSHFGYPYCHGKSIADPKFGKGKSCKDYVAPQIELSAHVAPLGIRFIKNTKAPALLKDTAVFAERGSWNRSSKIGYRVAYFKINASGKPGPVQDLVTGFLDGQKTLGRPVDVEELPDGSLLISDDTGNRIWRLSANAPQN